MDDTLYTEQDLLSQVFEESVRLDTRNTKYTLYYTNAGYHTESLQLLIEMMKIKFNDNSIILAIPDSEIINIDITSIQNCIVVKDFMNDLPPLWNNIVFFNFTLVMLQPRLFKVRRCCINYVAENNLNLIRFAWIRDKETLINTNFLRPSIDFNINNFIFPFRLVLNYYRNDHSYRNLKLKLITDAYMEESMTQSDLISPMSAYTGITRYISNLYKLSLQQCFKRPSVFIYLYSDDSFNRFLSQLYREELWIELLFSSGCSSIISSERICNNSISNRRKFFLRLNNLPIYINMTMDDYIKWQLWVLFLYGRQKNLITSLPTEVGVISRPFISTKYPCITLRGVDGLVVNSLATRSDFGVII